MDTKKRRRGRPPGEGKRDGQYLRKMAELLVQDQSMKPTTAMKVIYRQRDDWQDTEEAFVRRLQRKWSASSSEHMLAAQGGLEAAAPVTYYSMPDVVVSVSGAITAFRTSPVLQELSDSIRLFRETINSPEFVKRWKEAAEAFKAFQTSPVAKWLSEHRI